MLDIVTGGLFQACIQIFRRERLGVHIRAADAGAIDGVMDPGVLPDGLIDLGSARRIVGAPSGPRLRSGGRPSRSCTAESERSPCYPDCP